MKILIVDDSPPVSIGAASLLSSVNSRMDTLFDNAGKALGEAKTQGHNRVQCF
jgi:PleD family two-component response regulator